LKAEKDALESQASEMSTSATDLQSKISTLDASLTEARDKLLAAENERDVAFQEKSTSQEQTHSLEISIKEHQERLKQAAAALATNTRQIQSTQSELKNAIRRAEDAERTQKSLQTEGESLMRSLDEMRPKIVELTGAKLDLAERVESLEHTLRGRDSFISQLENDLGEARDQLEQVENKWKTKLTEQEKKHREIQNGNTDIQKAYAELQEEMDTALASLRNMESQRATQHQEAARRLEEMERLTNLSQTQAEELDTLRKELDARTKARVSTR
jgi:chromosome segregation ATPase